ncbi:hypothetical protein TNCV_3376601 [Trichonephila clavipes]|nr:hypothetical protein TNCV_3376601 [Trichonephila clavipes]
MEAGYDPSTYNKDHGFLFIIMLALTQPISSNSSWHQSGWCKLNIHYTRQISILLILRLKLVLKGKRFDDIPGIQRNVTRLLNSIPKEAFLLSFQNLYSRAQGYIVMGGDYFEAQ